jgi:hypothetical protein
VSSETSGRDVGPAVADVPAVRPWIVEVGVVVAVLVGFVSYLAPTLAPACRRTAAAS